MTLRLIILVACFGLIAGCGRQAGVTVTIENHGQTSLSSLSVGVAGANYPLGNVLPGQAVSVVVHPQHESAITVSYTDSLGTPNKLPVDCYIEPGYTGSINVMIASNQITHVQDQIRIKSFY